MKSTLIKLTAGVALTVAALQTQAHDIYIWPSYFSVNSEKAVKIPVQVTASHTTYRPDFAMPSDGVKVFGVDGKQQRRIGSYYQGARVATFDLDVAEQGTYGLKYYRGPSYRTSYKIGKRDTIKRLRANKSEAQAQIPQGAKEVVTTSYLTIAMSYVTNKAPTEAVLAAQNKGFELVPVTHPADYVTGEELEVTLLFNGKPVADQDLVIEQEGIQYLADPKALELKSDENGKVVFSFEQGGRYMLKVNHKQTSTNAEADYEVTRIYYAFDVIYE